MMAKKTAPRQPDLSSAIIPPASCPFGGDGGCRPSFLRLCQGLNDLGQLFQATDPPRQVLNLREKLLAATWLGGQLASPGGLGLSMERRSCSRVDRLSVRRFRLRLGLACHGWESLVGV